MSELTTNAKPNASDTPLPSVDIERPAHRAAFDSHRALWLAPPCGAVILGLLMARTYPTEYRTERPGGRAATYGARVPEAAALEAKRHALGFYMRQVDGGLFAPARRAHRTPVEEAKPETPKSVPVVLPDIDPFEDWVYAGSVDADGRLTALIENAKTKEGRFVKVGDTVLGARVRTITAGAVTINAAGRPRTLPRSNIVSVRQLDKDATLATTEGVAPAPGAPGPAVVPGQAPAMQNGLSGPGMVLSGGIGGIVVRTGGLSAAEGASAVSAGGAEAGGNSAGGATTAPTAVPAP